MIAANALLIPPFGSLAAPLAPLASRGAWVAAAAAVLKHRGGFGTDLAFSVLTT